MAGMGKHDSHAKGLKRVEGRSGLVQRAGELADVHLEFGEGLLALARHAHLEVLELALHALELTQLTVLVALEHAEADEQRGEHARAHRTAAHHHVAELDVVEAAVERRRH